MFSRCLPLLVVALVCVRGEAAPLSFSCVELGQKWDVFLKAHPKAEIMLSQFDNNGLTKAQEVEREGKKKEGVLVEVGSKKPFGDALYFFHERSLVQVSFFSARLNIRDEHGSVARSLLDLKPALRKLLDELGAPIKIGVTVNGGKRHQTLMVWTRPTQSAFAMLSWPLDKKPVATQVVLGFVNAPWRATNSSFRTSWPAVLAPNQEDETRRRQLVALLEELHPNSTERIEQLKPAPAINLFEKTPPAVKPKSPSIVIKPAK